MRASTDGIKWRRLIGAGLPILVGGFGAIVGMLPQITASAPSTSAPVAHAAPIGSASVPISSAASPVGRPAGSVFDSPPPSRTRPAVQGFSIKSPQQIKAMRSNPPSKAMIGDVLQGVGRGRQVSPEEILGFVVTAIRLYDADGDGLEVSEIARQWRDHNAQQMGRLSGRFSPFDSNSDLVLTGQEFDAAKSQGRVQEGLSDMFLKSDTDADGNLSWAEMTTLPEGYGTSDESFTSLLAVQYIDPDGDGSFTLAEAHALVERIMDEYDYNENGLMDQFEIEDFPNAVGGYLASQTIPSLDSEWRQYAEYVGAAEETVATASRRSLPQELPPAHDLWRHGISTFFEDLTLHRGPLVKESLLAEMAGVVRTADRGGDGLDPNDVRFYEGPENQMGAAWRGSNVPGNSLASAVLRVGEAFGKRAEGSAVTIGELEQVVDEIFLRYDQDKDSVIDHDEFRFLSRDAS